MPTNYPPYQDALLDPRTSRVSKAWHQFFLTLARVGDPTAIADSSVTYAKLQDVSAASRLLGRGSSGAGPVEELTLGTGLTMTGTTMSVTSGVAAAGYWTPITDGVTPIPQLLFDSNGDCIVGFVPTP